MRVTTETKIMLGAVNTLGRENKIILSDTKTRYIIYGTKARKAKPSNYNCGWAA